MKPASSLALVSLTLSAAPLFAQSSGGAQAQDVPAENTAAAYVNRNWKPPRTSWGHPSLEGVWNTDDMRGIPLNRPAEFGTRETLTPAEFAERLKSSVGAGTVDIPFLQHDFGTRTFGYTSLVVDPPNGRTPPLTPYGEQLMQSRARGTFGAGPFNDINDFSVYDRCITRGVLGSILPVIYGNGVRITQSPTSVAITYEMIHDTRVIPLLAAAPDDIGVQQWLGVPYGRWDGDTLVVTTTNFTNRTGVGGNGGNPPNSEQMTLQERYRRVDPEMIEYRATVNDPGAFTAPFTYRMMLTWRPGYETYEYSCHEGNGAVRNSLSGERSYERQVADALARGLPPPPRATEHNQIRNGPAEGARIFDINAGE